jgi:hypothetical protein
VHPVKRSDIILAKINIATVVPNAKNSLLNKICNYYSILNSLEGRSKRYNKTKVASFCPEMYHFVRLLHRQVVLAHQTDMT